MQMNDYAVVTTQLVGERATNEYLESWREHHPAGPTLNAEPPIKIKTGVFIQSLKFFNSTEVNLTGYIWQRYQDGIHDAIKPGSSEAGFILPEQVNSGSDIEPREVFRVCNGTEEVNSGTDTEPREAHRECNGKEEVIGWYFEATLRQPFDYAKYPFDHKTVWVRIWPKLFYKNIILVPDFAAYQHQNKKADVFGIEENIVLGTWVLENTYFDYKPSRYDTDFGIADYVGQQDYPELHYNIVVKRKFENAFIVYLLPLFLVAALLFAALLTVSEKEELSSRLGFNTAGFIGASSALFFVVMLAHIQLREQFAGTSIVYIEYFYILMYALLVAATANTYLFSIRSAILHNIILYNDNIIPKVAYWPLVLGCLIVITRLVM
jgi:hypothetical protein